MVKVPQSLKGRVFAGIALTVYNLSFFGAIPTAQEITNNTKNAVTDTYANVASVATFLPYGNEQKFDYGIIDPRTQNGLYTPKGFTIAAVTRLNGDFFAGYNRFEGGDCSRSSNELSVLKEVNGILTPVQFLELPEIEIGGRKIPSTIYRIELHNLDHDTEPELVVRSTYDCAPGESQKGERLTVFDRAIDGRYNSFPTLDIVPEQNRKITRIRILPENGSKYIVEGYFTTLSEDIHPGVHAKIDELGRDQFGNPYCLTVHNTPGLSTPNVACYGNGTEIDIVGGPVEADGHIFWQIERGWLAEGEGNERWIFYSYGRPKELRFVRYMGIPTDIEVPSSVIVEEATNAISNPEQQGYRNREEAISTYERSFGEELVIEAIDRERKINDWERRLGGFINEEGNYAFIAPEYMEHIFISTDTSIAISSAINLSPDIVDYFINESKGNLKRVLAEYPKDELPGLLSVLAISEHEEDLKDLMASFFFSKYKETEDEKDRTIETPTDIPRPIYDLPSPSPLSSPVDLSPYESGEPLSPPNDLSPPYGPVSLSSPAFPTYTPSSQN